MQFLERLISGTQVEDQSEQHGHGAEEEAQRLPGAHATDLAVAAKPSGLALPPEESPKAEQLGLEEVGCQAGHRQGDDGGFGHFVDSQLFDHQHFGPKRA